MSGLAGSVSLDEELGRRRTGVEAALARALDRLGPQIAPELSAAVRHGVLSGGKRLRPVLCVAAYEASGREAGDEVYDLAASLELVHAYSLMHDDLPCMDDAELRRGRPATHVEHGERATTRAGALLIPAAALTALRACRALGLDEASAARIARVLMEAAGAGGMVGGQWLDLLGEGERLEADALTALHRRKTGALLAASLHMGGAAAGAGPDTLSALDSYGRRIGLAFQIADDVLDATRSADDLGKNPSDEALDKSTYVGLYGVDGARRRAEAEIAGAIEALEGGGVESGLLVALARFVVERER